MPNRVLTPEKALLMLMEGNSRFTLGAPSKNGVDRARMAELVQGQDPFAVVLCCSDSRVSPLHIFDQWLGDIFVIRVAGNITGPCIFGSIEYALENLHTPLVMVLGHQNCGAVTAALDNASGSRHMRSIVSRISRVAGRMEKKDEDRTAMINRVVAENVRVSAEELRTGSMVIKDRLRKDRVRVIEGVYCLRSGSVELLDPWSTGILQGDREPSRDEATVRSLLSTPVKTGLSFLAANLPVLLSQADLLLTSVV